MSNEKSTGKYHIHISSKHKWFDLKLKEVWQYKDLIWLFTKRSFVVKYKQTILGPAWLFLSPLITSFIYTFIFGGIAGMSTDGIPQILFYMAKNEGRALTREMLLSNIWGYDYFGETNVVDVYIRYLRSKLEEVSETKYIQTVRGVGYVIK